MSISSPISFARSGASLLKAGIDAPSGQTLELFEVLVDQVGDEAWLRFRFHAPQIGRGADDLRFAQVESDFDVLCSGVALPYMRDFDLHADRIVVSLLSEKLEFGQSDPDVTQFIEVFSPADDTCIWEGL